MALTIAEILRAVNPNIGLVVNLDGTYRIGVEDVNSDEVLAALLAIQGVAESGAVVMAHTAPVIAAGTTLALAANANRDYALFANDGDETVYLEFGDDAVMNEGIPILSGGSYEMSRQIGNLDVRVANAICASGGLVLLVAEGV